MDAAHLLTVWENADGQPLIRRALALLVAAWPERTAEEWARVPVGERDGRLLSLREALFGSHLEGIASCPECGEVLELAFATRDIRVPVAPPAEAVTVVSHDYRLQCRVPNSLDVLAAAELLPAEQRAGLIQRCLVAAEREGQPVPTAGLPEAVVEAMVQQLQEADPQAAVELALACPSCGHRWLTAFDIVSYLWSEIDDWARRLLRDVHALASAYGWSERDILAMTARRRQLYLGLLGA